MGRKILRSVIIYGFKVRSNSEAGKQIIYTRRACQENILLTSPSWLSVIMLGVDSTSHDKLFKYYNRLRTFDPQADRFQNTEAVVEVDFFQISGFQVLSDSQIKITAV